MGAVSHPGDMSIGADQHGSGSTDRPECRKLPRTDTRQHQPGRACARDQDIGIPHGHQTAPVVRNGGCQPARVPTEEMSTCVFPKGFHKAANRSFAILELRWFGPISKSGGVPVHLADGLGAGLELVEDLQGALMSGGYNSGWRSIKSRAEVFVGFRHAIPFQ
jgi:hypothetical protein